MKIIFRNTGLFEGKEFLTDPSADISWTGVLKPNQQESPGMIRFERQYTKSQVVEAMNEIKYRMEKALTLARRCSEN